MAYSNGYNNTTVLPALFGRLAWVTDPTLNTANKTSASGRYFDDGSFHSLVTVPNVKASMALPVSPNTWDSVLTAKQNGIISRALNGVFNIPEYVDQCKVYSQDDSEIEQTVTNAGKAVGYKVEVVKDFDKTVQVNSLELYFDGAATFNIYLFKQGSKAALQTKSVTTVANRKVSVPLTDWILNFREAGIYYVVYFQDDLGSVQAIREQACFATGKYFYAEAMETNVITGVEFNRQSPSFPSQPAGLNMQISSFRDFTSNILNQPHMFDELLGLTMAYSVIEDILYTVRSNDKERILKEQLDKIGVQLDLNGAAPISDSPQVTGLKQRIDRETARVKKAFYPQPKAQTVNYADNED
jgi:hypothetical protein